MNKKSGEETRFLSHFSKTDFRYWNEAVFRKRYTKGGRQLFTKEWYARIQHDGRRDFFPLQTADGAAAASRARDTYRHLISQGFGPTLAKYKPELLKEPFWPKPDPNPSPFARLVFRSIVL
jgi:hypothetical protein